MIERILAVLDSESANEAIVARLRELAGEATSVELLTIVHEPHLDGYLGNTEIYAPLRKRLVDEEAEKAGQLASKLSSLGVNASFKAVWDWPHGDAIRREAFAANADLIIVSFGAGRHRHIGARDWRFLAECPLPVLVVNSTGEKHYRRVLAAVDPVHAHAKPAELDEHIAGLGTAVSERTGASIELVHGFVPLARYGADLGDGMPLPLNDAEKALERSRREALADLARKAGIDAKSTRLVEGQPEAVLEDLVGGDDSCLLVMGALSRGKLADFVIGSTAERVLHHAPCDVLLVKPAGHAA